MNGILCINKPSGWTSFDVVAKTRGITKTKKIGHSGTLDPMATGVLPLFFGSATKACDLMPNSDKGYLAQFRFGMTTDTLDITGTVLTEQESHVTQAQLCSVLERFSGEQEQLPPMYSAVQVNGRRLYDIARAGGEVERTPRRITVYKLTLLHFDEENQLAECEVLCSKGTYIRSLCSDIGEALGTGAVLSALQRHVAGNFTLADCYTLEEIQQLAAAGTLEEKLLPVERVFAEFPELQLNAVQASKFANGVKLDLNRLPDCPADGSYRVLDEQGQFLGLGVPDREAMELRIGKLFKR